jgi:hypothetical protein
MKQVLLLFVLALGCLPCFAQSKPAKAALCRPPDLTTHEDGIMFGRLAAAIEDLGGGYLKEAEGRYSHIVHDVEKKSFHPCLRWMAYDGYAETLTALKKKEKAIAMASRAVELAKDLSVEEREESAKHLDAAQSLK